VQLVSVPVRAVPDVSFVYGLIHLYKNVHREAGGAVHVSLEAGFPLQGKGEHNPPLCTNSSSKLHRMLLLLTPGVLVSSQRKLVLFSTPYKSQRLYLRMGSGAHYNDSIPQPSAPATSKPALPLWPGNAVDSSTSEIGGADAAAGAGSRKEQRRLISAAEYSIPHVLDAYGMDLALSADNHQHNRRGVDFEPLHGQKDVLLQKLVRGLLNKLHRTVHNQPGSALHYTGNEDITSLGLESEQQASHRRLSQQQNQTQLDQQIAAMLAASLDRLGIFSITPAATREVKLTPVTPQGFLSVVLTDRPLQGQGNSSTSNSTRTATGKSTAGTDSNTTDSTNTASTNQEDFLVSIAIGETLLPARFKALQSGAAPPSVLVNVPTNQTNSKNKIPVECQYTMQFTPTSRSSQDQAEVDSDPAQVTLPAHIEVTHTHREHCGILNISQWWQRCCACSHVHCHLTRTPNGCGMPTNFTVFAAPLCLLPCMHDHSRTGG
jgi:hypothetical protein